MRYNREHISKELKVFRKQVVQLQEELGKKKDESLNVERIGKKLEAISEKSLQLLAELGGDKEEIRRQIDETIVKKNQVERFIRFSEELCRFLSRGHKVVTASTHDEMVRQLFQIVGHAEGLWNDATLLFKEGRYATALFLSIVCIEECAKINFGRFQIHSSFSNSPQLAANPQRRNALTSHDRKHFLAACSGALVNSRMDRIFGIEKVNSFISDCENGNLEKLRQSCLYVDINQSGHKVLIPTEQINRDQALFYICLAGELLAEAGGVEPSTHQRLLDKVDKFEKQNG